MQIPIDNTKWQDRILAAFLYFTRIPLRKIKNPDKKAFESVREYWSLTGWLTGGTMGIVVYLVSLIAPLSVAVLSAIGIRLLVSGAMHENEFAIFFSAFSQNVADKRRVILQMRERTTNNFGIIALIIYFLFLFALLVEMGDPVRAAFIVLAADPFCKMLSAQTTRMMSYINPPENIDNEVSFRKYNTAGGLILFASGLIPLTAVWMLSAGHVIDVVVPYEVVFVPGIVMYFLYLFIWRRIEGYTEACCGAAFLIIELSFYAAILLSS